MSALPITDSSSKPIHANPDNLTSPAKKDGSLKIEPKLNGADTGTTTKKVTEIGYKQKISEFFSKNKETIAKASLLAGLILLCVAGGALIAGSGIGSVIVLTTGFAGLVCIVSGGILNRLHKNEVHELKIKSFEEEANKIQKFFNDLPGNFDSLPDSIDPNQVTLVNYQEKLLEQIKEFKEKIENHKTEIQAFLKNENGTGHNGSTKERLDKVITQLSDLEETLSDLSETIKTSRIQAIRKQKIEKLGANFKQEHSLLIRRIQASQDSYLITSGAYGIKDFKSLFNDVLAFEEKLDQAQKQRKSMSKKDWANDEPYRSLLTDASIRLGSTLSLKETLIEVDFETMRKTIELLKKSYKEIQELINKFPNSEENIEDQLIELKEFIEVFNKAIKNCTAKVTDNIPLISSNEKKYRSLLSEIQRLSDPLLEQLDKKIENEDIRQMELFINGLKSNPAYITALNYVVTKQTGKKDLKILKNEKKKFEYIEDKLHQLKTKALETNDKTLKKKFF